MIKFILHFIYRRRLRKNLRRLVICQEIQDSISRFSPNFRYSDKIKDYFGNSLPLEITPITNKDMFDLSFKYPIKGISLKVVDKELKRILDKINGGFKHETINGK